MKLLITMMLAYVVWSAPLAHAEEAEFLFSTSFRLDHSAVEVAGVDQSSLFLGGSFDFGYGVTKRFELGFRGSLSRASDAAVSGVSIDGAAGSFDLYSNVTDYLGSIYGRYGYARAPFFRHVPYVELALGFRHRGFSDVGVFDASGGFSSLTVDTPSSTALAIAPSIGVRGRFSHTICYDVRAGLSRTDGLNTIQTSLGIGYLWY